MRPPLFTWLSSSSEVQGYLGGTIFKAFWDVVPQDTAPPYVRALVVTGQPENYLGSVPGIDNTRVQLDLFAKTQAELDAMYVACRGALEPNTHIVSFNGSGIDEPTGLYFISFDISGWTNR